MGLIMFTLDIDRNFDRKFGWNFFLSNYIDWNYTSIVSTINNYIVHIVAYDVTCCKIQKTY